MREALNDESDEEYTEKERQSLAKTFAMAQVHNKQLSISSGQLWRHCTLNMTCFLGSFGGTRIRTSCK